MYEEKNAPLTEIWKDTMREVLQVSRLTVKQKKEWEELGENLGYLDCEMQLVLLQICQEHFQDFIREEQENMETAIVYISANSSYAMDLFRVQPTDFLIKPLDKIKVGNVMDRIQKISEVRKGIFEYFGSGYYFKVLYKDILYFSSQNKKVHLVLKDGQKEFNGKLKEIAKKIPGNFIQIHQSYLINFDYIEECSYESVKMKNGDTIPISQPYRKSVRKQLAERVWRDRE